MTDEEFERFVDYVEKNLGHSTTYYERKHLKRRFNARMRRIGLDEDDYDGYRDVLEDDERERRELLDTMSINVTEFFRNPEVWRSIQDVLAELTDLEPRVRAWSVPCSDGREPYSLAMLAVHDDRIDEARVDVLGTDIDPVALERAREGVYPEGHTNDAESEIEAFDPSLVRFLERSDGAFRVAESVRRSVEFERHDVISGEPKRGIDLLLCRNLMIYIEERYKSSLVENLDEAIDGGGYLVIGKTETLPPTVRDRYEAVDNEHRIYRRR